MFNHTRIIVLILSFLSLSQQARGASFDCGAATSHVEQLICSDETLSQADEELTASYKNAFAIDPSVKDTQVKWLNEVRNKCKDVNCLTVAYLDQLSVWEAIISSHKVDVLKSVKQNSPDYEVNFEQGAPSEVVPVENGQGVSSEMATHTLEASTPTDKRKAVQTTLLAIAVIFLFLVLNGIRLGLTDTLIFYENGWDVFLTLLVWILPLFLSFGALFAGYTESKEASSELAQLSRDMNLPFTLGISAVASWLLMTIIVFAKNIKLNGFGFSSMCVFVAKMTVSFSLFFSWGRWNDSEKPIGARVNAFIVFALLAMFTARLTNGTAVKRGRMVKAGNVAPAF